MKYLKRTSNKYLLIGHKYGKIKRGAHVTSIRFSSLFPDVLDYIEDILFDFNKIEKYKRLVFITQFPRLYTPPLNSFKLKNKNYIIYIRQESDPLLYNSCTNGFNYYKNHNDIKFFVPMIADFHVDFTQKILPCIGFYCRPNVTPDSLRCIVSLLKKVKYKFEVFSLGYDFPEIQKISNVIKYTNTTNNEDFFKNITHFIYPTSKFHIDPFPNSLLEAVQCNKQIIIPTIKRNFKDGIDDIKSCINYQETISDKILDNSNCIISTKNLTKFYKKVFDNNWEYSFDRTKFKTFYDWIVSEI